MKNPRIYYSLFLLACFALFFSCEEDKIAELHTVYLDSDGDGFGDQTKPLRVATLPPPAGYVVDNTDLDDNDSSITTNDCAERNTFFKDDDEDGLGDLNNKLLTCLVTPPAGYVTNADDCDDSIIIEEGPFKQYLDEDGDGFGNPETEEDIEGCPIPEGYVTNGTDLDDENENAYPGAIWYLDSDGDGFGDFNNPKPLETVADFDSYVLDNTDCNDEFSFVNPDQDEDLGDGVDNNCDGISGVIWPGNGDEDDEENVEIVHFSMPFGADWTLPENQDDLGIQDGTVVFTRQSSSPLPFFNVAWWAANVGGNAPIHNDPEESDLLYLLTGDDSYQESPGIPEPVTGGPTGLRFVILDEEAGAGGNVSWPYGTLGNPNNYSSLNNIMSALTVMSTGGTPRLRLNDFEITASINGEEQVFTDSIDFTALNHTKIGVWDVKSDTYWWIRVNEFDPLNMSDLSYTRSAPPAE